MKQKGQRFDTQALTQEAQALTRDVVSAPFRLRTYRMYLWKRSGLSGSSAVLGTMTANCRS